MLNFGAALQAIAIDTDCGFESEAALASQGKLELEDHEHAYLTGQVTREIEECTIELNNEALKWVDSRGNGHDIVDCNGLKTFVSGKVTVKNAQQIRHGVLTGISYQPVIPQGDLPVNMRFGSVEFENFQAYYAHEPQKNPARKMLIKSGEMRADVSVHLAKDASIGLCAVQIPNVTIHSLEYKKPAEVRLPGLFSDFDVTLEEVSLNNIQAGIWYKENGDEIMNQLNGTVTVWGNRVLVPADNLGLDPEFTPEAFENSFICKELGLDPNLKPPLQFDCEMDRFLAITSARLMAQNIAGITSEISNENQKWFSSIRGCGFGAKQSYNNSTVTNFDNQAEISIPVSNCDIGTANETEYTDSTSCGDASYINGYAKVDGTLVARGLARPTCGINTGGYFLPGNDCSKIPRINQDTPFNTQMSIRADGFERSSNGFSFYTIPPGSTRPFAKLAFKTGGLAYQVVPLWAPKPDNQCRFELISPIAKINNVVAQAIETKLTVKLPSDSVSEKDQEDLSFNYKINSSNLDMMNGVYLGEGNYLVGSIEINGTTHTFDEEDEIKLNPSYSQKSFDESYTCAASDISTPISTNENLMANCN